jgi:hypothetical protein
LSALWIDPPDNLTHPARTLPQPIPSCSANLNAVLYQASGPGPHPTALPLHRLCNARRWSLPSSAARLAGRPLYIATADDGFVPGGDRFADAVLAFGGGNLIRFATDHSYSTCRIELQSRLLLWLDAALGHWSACPNGSTALIDMNRG